MAALNIRDFDEELRSELKSEAAKAGIKLREYVTLILKNRGEVWPVYSLDGTTGAVSIIPNAGLVAEEVRKEAGAGRRKKIAKIMVGGAAKGGATPGLSAVGKAQDEANTLVNYGRSGIAPDFNEVHIPLQAHELYPEKKIAEVRNGVEGRGAEGKIGGAAGGHAEAVAKGPDGAQGGQVGVGKPGVDMDALRAICAGSIPGGSSFSPNPVEIDLCGFKSYNETDGEFYVCGKEKHSEKIKHGDWIQV